MLPLLKQLKFFVGESVRVNKELSNIFLQMHSSVKTGRGIPKIINYYAKNVVDFRENSISVSIPFNWINVVLNNLNDISIIKNYDGIYKNPRGTGATLKELVGTSETSINNNIKKLREFGHISSVGTKKF